MSSFLSLPSVDSALEPLDEEFGRPVGRGEIVAGWLVAGLLLVALALF